ncbi:MAG: crotonobetainyl-CoA:carnitine CoA-transferase CaiB-like acyl-CoA transferase [Polaribacter sp.]
MSGPLKGLTVLDLSRVLAGPWATQVLADFGAKVWKVERPQKGDDTRHWGESLLEIRQKQNVKSEPLKQGLYEQAGADISAYYLCANRGKQSITLDITTAAGQEIVKDLALKADIFVENFKVGNLAKYGLDYQSLAKLNPKLVYCSITGFGQTGEYASQAGYDAMIQASAGLMSVTGEKEGEPQKVGVAVSDLMTGMYAVSGILAAIHYRDKTGLGQYIDLALFDTQVGWLANQSMSYLLTGEVPIKQGTVHPSIVPYQTVQSSTGKFMLAVGNDHQFKKCMEVLGLTELSENLKYKTNNARIKNHDTLIGIMENVLVKMPSDYWVEKLSNKKIPCGSINNIEQVFEHPQIKARGTKVTIEHSQLGTIQQVANPLKFSETPIQYKNPAPVLGENSVNILKDELNYSDTEIEELRRMNII